MTLDPYRRLTLWLLALCVLAITHGSLYPWIFQAPAAGIRLGWQRLWSWTSNPLFGSSGDLVGNVLLFIPLGMLAWRATVGWRWGGLARWTCVMVASMAFALVLQVAQIWLPTRTAAVSDVVWNALGMLIGIAAWRSADAPVSWLSQRLRSAHLLGYVMALFWLILQWWPLLPLLQREVLRGAWKRLIHIDGWAPLQTELAALALVVVMHLLRGLRGRLAVAVALVLTAHLGSFVFVLKTSTASSVASNTVGWGLGLLLGLAVWALQARSANRALLACAALGWLLSALAPFALASVPTAMHWVPLTAALTEPRVAHTSALLWQAFWISALLIGAQREGWRLPRVALGLTLLVAGVEWLQRWIPGQQADITPLAFPTLCAWLLWRLLQRHQRLHALQST